jgi:hypothetical protein
MSKPQKRCIFCGGAPLTREHIWPQWLRAHLPIAMINYQSLQAIEHRRQTDRNVSTRSGDPHSWRIRVVCARCNNGWMSQLEMHFQPILVPLLKGQIARLTPRQQQTLAAWAALKVMVAEFDRTSHRVSHHMHRKRLMRRQLPPVNGWRIWIGNYKRDKWVPRWVTHSFLIRSDTVVEQRGEIATFYNSQASTHVVGDLYIHIIRSPMPNLARDFSFQRVPNAGAKLRSIWPPNSYSIVWPAPTMTDKDADDIAGAFLELGRRSAQPPPRNSQTPRGGN